MDNLYCVEYKYNFEDYKKFSWYCFLSKKTIIAFLLVIIVSIFLAFYFKELLFIITIVAYLLLITLIQNRQIKKTFNSNKVFQSEDKIVYEFCDSYFTVKTDISSAKIEYSKLYKILDKKQTMYLMIAKNQGYILKKDVMPEGLYDFILSKK